MAINWNIRLAEASLNTSYRPIRPRSDKHQIDSNINKPFIRVCSGLGFSHTHWRLSTPHHATSHIISGGKFCPMSCPVSNLHSYTSSKSLYPKALGLTFPADIKLKYAKRPPALPLHPPWNAPAHRWRSLLVPNDEALFQRCSLSMLIFRVKQSPTTLITAESGAKN